MREHFEKLRKKFLAAALIKCAAVGAACAVAAVAVLLFVQKFSPLGFAPWLIALIAIAALICAFGITFLIIRPSAANVARTLDEDYNLRERVRTALAYEGESGAVTDVQRLDAAEKLQTLKLRRPTAREIWQYPLIAFLALALLIAALVVPSRSFAAPDPDLREFRFSERNRLVIEECIDDVNDLSLASTLKPRAAAPLSALLDDQTGLPAATTVGEAKGLVADALDELNSVLDDRSSLSYAALSVRAGEAGLMYIVRAVRRGTNVYANVPLLSEENLKEFDKNKGSLAYNAVSFNLEAYRAVLAADGEFETTLSTLRSALSYTLIGSGFDQTDRLYAALDNFSNALVSIHDPDDLIAPFGDASLAVSEAVAGQAFRLALNRSVDLRLWKEFGLAEQPIPTYFNDRYEYDSDGSLGQDVDPDNPDDDDGNNDGGYGDGGGKYGSDDLVFDPYTGEYVPYGELLQRYNAIIQEYLSNGDLTEEQKAIIRQYVDALYGGIDDEE